MKRLSQIGILRPLAAAIAFVGVVALVILGYRSYGDRRKSAQTPAVPQPPPQSLPVRAPAARRRSRRMMRFGIRHPLSIALVVVILVVISTIVYFFQFAERQTVIGGIEHQPSEYDEFFTYSQMEAMTHFAKCDAMLFSTTPEEELEHVKERMAIEVEFDSSAGAGAASQDGRYTRRVRTPEEIAEAVRLASEFYERVNCQ